MSLWPLLGIAVLIAGFAARVNPLIVVFTAVAAVRLTPALSWVALTLGVPAMVFAVLEAVEPTPDWIVLTSGAVHPPLYF